MPNKDPLMEEAQNWIATQLDRTGEFSEIEIGYRFGDPTLDEQHNRNICVKRSDQAYLLIVHSDILHHGKPMRKLGAATRRNIYGLNIHYKAGESPFFDLESKRGDGGTARTHISLDERNRHVKLTRHEREIYDVIGNVVYFNPENKTLEVLEFPNATPPKYDTLAPSSHYDAEQVRIMQSRSGPYRTIKDHRIIAAYSDFTLRTSEEQIKDIGKMISATPTARRTYESKLLSLFALEDAVLANRQKDPSVEKVFLDISKLLEECHPETLDSLIIKFSRKKLKPYLAKEKPKKKEETPGPGSGNVGGCCIPRYWDS